MLTPSGRSMRQPPRLEIPEHLEATIASIYRIDNNGPYRFPRLFYMCLWWGENFLACLYDTCPGAVTNFSVYLAT
ncbi:Ketoisovalerate reductase BEA2 [Fusarium oxysporum f. sp. albedinis]|nr:Ketoisovalerate reductase BEA2 [Fusarium oxysporum f. sp. albedinis]